jgi:hypothetical protein
VPPRHTHRLLVAIPPAAQATRMVMTMPFTGTGSIRSFPGQWESPRVLPEGLTLDPMTMLGPVETLESLRANDLSGLQTVVMENSGRPEYLTEWSSPAPWVAAQAEFRVNSYALTLQLNRDEVRLTNHLAAVEGTVVFYEGEGSTHPGLIAEGRRHRAQLSIKVAEGVDLWRLQIVASRPVDAHLEIFLLFETDEGWRVHSSAPLASRGDTVMTVASPKSGVWKFVTFARAFDDDLRPVRFEVSEAQLRQQAETPCAYRAHGEAWSEPYPGAAARRRAAAFRIAGTPGDERQAAGVLVALTLARDGT